MRFLHPSIMKARYALNQSISSEDIIFIPLVKHKKRYKEVSKPNTVDEAQTPISLSSWRTSPGHAFYQRYAEKNPLAMRSFSSLRERDGGGHTQ